MKILIFSDLHLEFAPFQPDRDAVQAADVVVLAGDIHQWTFALPWIARSFAGKPVVYVAGNHEFYSHHWDSTLQALRVEAVEHGVHFLENEAVKLGGVRFLGCTLWTDFAVHGESTRGKAMMDFASGLNDCRMISAGPMHEGVGPTARRLTPEEVLQRHVRSRMWLTAQLAAGSESTVVVTHHLPSARSVASRYRGDHLTPGFASELPLELLVSANVWVHGHTHDSCDYRVPSKGRSLRVICNPRGYPRRDSPENKQFRDDYLVEV